MSEQDASEVDAGDDHEDDTDATDGESGDFPLDDVDVDVDGADFEAELDESAVERVEESDPRSVAVELAALRTRISRLEDQLDASETELDDVTSKLKRKQADFQNYKKRMEKRREQEKQRATEDLVERLLDVRDNLVRALEQDDPDLSDIRDGVESTLRGFDRILAEENVTVVDPDPGDSIDPQRHEVLMRTESDQPADTVAAVHRPGYVMAEKVLRPAQITVSDDAGDDGGDRDGDDA